jgi:hypothetical protein
MEFANHGITFKIPKPFSFSTTFGLLSILTWSGMVPFELLDGSAFFASFGTLSSYKDPHRLPCCHI